MGSCFEAAFPVSCLEEAFCMTRSDGDWLAEVPHTVGRSGEIVAVDTARSGLVVDIVHLAVVEDTVHLVAAVHIAQFVAVLGMVQIDPIASRNVSSRYYRIDASLHNQGSPTYPIAVD